MFTCVCYMYLIYVHACVLHVPHIPTCMCATCTYMQTPTQVFIVRKIDTVFTLERPFKASWLKLEINDGIITPSGRICWHLTLYGCPVEHGML